ncbi:MAG: molybdopterin-binding protein [Spirochaetia bacterium]|jgi:molybdopterin biosynthesis enzyme|nr:molybdopterin-binding protein [Spirochaetia bacterium]
MKLIRTEDAVGHVLCHDMTQIIVGKTKDARFRKGHIVQKEDIPVLLSMGKENLYVWEKQEGMLHENEAAEILCQATKNRYMERSEVKEGKIELTAMTDGVLKIDTKRLYEINSLVDIMIATRPNYSMVHKGDKLAGMRIIPLVIDAKKMDAVSAIATVSDPLLELVPYTIRDCTLIVTGNEVKKGLIKDTFSPVVTAKLKAFGVQVSKKILTGDNGPYITSCIKDAVSEGSQMVLCTGGMSVDPDDRTPKAIKDSGATVISYGAPVLPGAMFLVSYLDGVPVLGLPGCVMYAKRTVFDLMLPRVLAKIPIAASDIAALGNGGLCLQCPVCTFPNCGFGHGGI